MYGRNVFKYLRHSKFLDQIATEAALIFSFRNFSKTKNSPWRDTCTETVSKSVISMTKEKMDANIKLYRKMYIQDIKFSSVAQGRVT